MFRTRLGVLTDQPDDYTLMQAAVGGDEGAFRALYDRHAPAVLGVCRRVIRDPADAEQIATDVFWEFWRNRTNYSASRGSVLTYLMLLARSRSVDWLRSRRARPSTPLSSAPEPDAPAMHPAEGLIADETHAALHDAMGLLRPPEREAVEASFFEGLSHTEISLKLGRPLGTVKTQLRQALFRLRDRLRQTTGTTDRLDV